MNKHFHDTLIHMSLFTHTLYREQTPNHHQPTTRTNSRVTLRRAAPSFVMSTVNDERTPLVPERASSSRDIARRRVLLGVLAVVTGVFASTTIRDDRGRVARALGR